MGQTQGKEGARDHGGRYELRKKQGQTGGHNQLFSPVAGSPLTYSPQIPMEPLHARDFNDSPMAGQSAVDMTGMVFPAQPKLVPTVIHWSFGGAHVEVEGSWDNWTSRTVLQHSGKDFTIIKLLAPGVYQYKYIVDGQWRYAPNLPAMYDDIGNINNVLEVQEFIPENLENLTGFEPPPSPPDSYSIKNTLGSEDYSKDAPALPQHLNLTLLNVPPAMDASASLPRPQHVILSHLFMQKGANPQVLVMGSTLRYKSKYVTCVIYKPSQQQTRWSSAMVHTMRMQDAQDRGEGMGAQDRTGAAASASSVQHTAPHAVPGHVSGSPQPPGPGISGEGSTAGAPKPGGGAGGGGGYYMS